MTEKHPNKEEMHPFAKEFAESFLQCIPDYLEMNLVDAADPNNPKSLSPILLEMNYHLQEMSHALRFYTSSGSAPPTHVLKAIEEMQMKLAFELNDLNVLASKFRDEPKPCCRLSARLDDPFIGGANVTELRRLLSQVLDF
jgi:hypothetical protein